MRVGAAPGAGRVAFFFLNSMLGRIVAQYPSPAGATESLLDPAAWDAVAAKQPARSRAGARRRGAHRAPNRGGNECYLVPIDACYELVGRPRMHWTGFDGGEEARRTSRVLRAGAGTQCPAAMGTADV